MPVVGVCLAPLVVRRDEVPLSALLQGHVQGIRALRDPLRGDAVRAAGPLGVADLLVHAVDGPLVGLKVVGQALAFVLRHA